MTPSSPDRPLRIAWFSPMPPARSGVAACSAELVSLLARQFEVDIFVDAGVTPLWPAARSAHDFVWLHRRAPYDLTVYQVGNSAHHDYLWPYLFRYPGLVILHDVHLHHARAALLLRAGRAEHYRHEFVANHSGAHPDMAELAIAGFDSHLHYRWPMTTLVIRGSRLTAVHGKRLAEMVTDQVPGADVESIHLGHGRLMSDEQLRAAGARVRAQHGIPAEAVVFGCYGGLSPEKRIPQAIEAFVATRAHIPQAHLLLAGAAADHYDLMAGIRRHALEPCATVTGYLESEESVDEHIAACDVAVNLRWPTAREVSGPWLRCLAAGKPTIIIGLAHLTDVPSLDPRTWLPSTPGPGTGSEPESDGWRPPVCVAVDILDEAHSLRRAMHRLARDGMLRATLGRQARQYWLEEHSVARMVADYVRLIATAAGLPLPSPILPPHLVDDGDRRLRSLMAPFGLAADPLR